MVCLGAGIGQRADTAAVRRAMFVHVEVHEAAVCVDPWGVKPLIGVTTSELRPGELATLRRHGEPPNPEMALGMTYVRALEAAGALPVVLPPLVNEDAGTRSPMADRVVPRHQVSRLRFPGDTVANRRLFHRAAPCSIHKTGKFHAASRGAIRPLHPAGSSARENPASVQ